MIMNNIICGMQRSYLINMYDDENDDNADDNAADVADVAVLLRMPLMCFRLLPLLYSAYTYEHTNASALMYVQIAIATGTCCTKRK